MFYIFTPTYNAEKYLDQTIESVVTQNIPVRYHVQDGGSTDGTLEILQRWQKNLNNSIVSFSYNSEKDNGMYDAINKAVSGLIIGDEDFLGWINADDLLYKNALSSVIKYVQNTHCTVDWVYGLPSRIEKNDEEEQRCAVVYYPQPLIASGLADGIHWSFFQQEGSFFRKRLWDKAGGCDARFRLAGDWDLWQRMASISPPVQIPLKLGTFRIRPGQLSANLSAYWGEIEKRSPMKIRRKRMRLHALLHPMSALRLEATGHMTTVSFGLKARVRCLMLALGLYGVVRSIQSVFRIVNK